MSKFSTYTQWLLVHEAGFVDHPEDPGGATNKGVTHKVYAAWRKSRGLDVQSVRLITRDEAVAIYREQYWDAVRGDELPFGLDYAVYDFCVNSGAARAAIELQKLLGVKQDGVIGAVTLAAVNAHPNLLTLIAAYVAARWAFMGRLKHFPTFKNGWHARLFGEEDGQQDHDVGVLDRAVRLARGAPLPEPRPMLEQHKAEGAQSKKSAATDLLKDPEALKAGAGVLGALGALASGSGPIQWAIAVALIAVVLVIVVERFRRKSV